MPLSGENAVEKKGQLIESQSVQVETPVLDGTQVHGKVNSMKPNVEQVSTTETASNIVEPISNEANANVPTTSAIEDAATNNSALDAAKKAAVTATNKPAQNAINDTTLTTIDPKITQNKTLEHTTQQVGTAPLPLESTFTWGGYFQAIGTLLILLAVLWAVVWLMRKYGRFNFLPKPGAFPRDGLRLESQLPLGPRKGLMVVRFLNKRLLLGVTDHQITLLKETADDENDDNSMEFKDIMEMAKCQKSDD